MSTYIGIDVHKDKCQIAVLLESGITKTAGGTKYKLASNTKVASSRPALEKALEKYPGANVLIEASTVSRWIARALREMGLEVVVADPNYRMMYAARKEGTKTDRTDAEALAIALKNGHFRVIHEVNSEIYGLRKTIRTRQMMIKTRIMNRNAVKAIYSAEGIKLTKAQLKAIIALDPTDDLAQIPDELRDAVRPFLVLLHTAGEQIAKLDQRLAEIADNSEVAQRLQTIPGVGPLVALGFIATIDEASRFQHASGAASYCGLTPTVYSSAGKTTYGGISKQGPAYLRSLLMQAALGLMKSKSIDVAGLKTWRDAIADRRGKKIANTALCRRLVHIMFAMMRDGTTFGHPLPSKTKKYTINKTAA